MIYLQELVCPACGINSLWASGKIGCTDPDCPRPTAAQEILSDPETEHRVTFTAGHGFTIRHPLRERLDDALMSCQLHFWLTHHIPDAADRPGEYRATEHGGRWLFVPLRTETKDDHE